MKFNKGEKVDVLVGKYKGQTVFITDIHIGFQPVQYSCEALNRKILLLAEDEIQSMYQHDMAMMKDWKELPDPPEE